MNREEFFQSCAHTVHFIDSVGEFRLARLFEGCLSLLELLDLMHVSEVACVQLGVYILLFEAHESSLLQRSKEAHVHVVPAEVLPDQRVRYDQSFFDAADVDLLRADVHDTCLADAVAETGEDALLVQVDRSEPELLEEHTYEKFNGMTVQHVGETQHNAVVRETLRGEREFISEDVTHYVL